MTKLLSTADGSLDGVYSARFKGLIKNLPPSEVLDEYRRRWYMFRNEFF
jgi:hypothetical protein